MNIQPWQIESFINGYLACALWSSTDTLHDADGNEIGTIELDNFDWAPGVAEKLHQDCRDFIQANEADLIAYTECGNCTQDFDPFNGAGHDFWLTRNSHGAGFWDRGLGELGERLTYASKTYGGVDLYLGSDELVYVV